MKAAQGILTVRGGMTSHAAVVADVYKRQVPISAYYHSLYQKLVYKTIQLLLDKQDYSQITSICQTAIGIEPFDEEFHYHLVYSLYQDCLLYTSHRSDLLLPLHNKFLLNHRSHRRH